MHSGTWWDRSCAGPEAGTQWSLWAPSRSGYSISPYKHTQISISLNCDAASLWYQEIHWTPDTARHTPDTAPHTSEERGNTLAWASPGKLKPEVRSTLQPCHELNYRPASSVPERCFWYLSASEVLISNYSKKWALQPRKKLMLPFHKVRRGFLINCEIYKITVRCVFIKLRMRAFFNALLFFQSKRDIIHRKILLIYERAN